MNLRPEYLLPESYAKMENTLFTLLVVLVGEDNDSSGLPGDEH